MCEKTLTFRIKIEFKMSMHEHMGDKNVTYAARVPLNERSDRHVINIAIGDTPILKLQKFKLDPTMHA